MQGMYMSFILHPERENLLQIHMRGSRKFCQREYKLDIFFVFFF